MKRAHFETELLPYLRGDLAAEERERVAEHLAGCASCRREFDAARALLAALRAERPEAPALDWARYRTELRKKLEERPERRPARPFALTRIVPVAAAAAIAAIALVFAVRRTEKAAGEDVPPFGEVAIGSQLDLLQDYALLEHIDLLEDLDVVQDLEEPKTVGEG